LLPTPFACCEQPAQQFRLTVDTARRKRGSRMRRKQGREFMEARKIDIGRRAALFILLEKKGERGDA